MSRAAPKSWKSFPSRRAPVLTPSRFLLFSMYLPLRFAPHAACFCLPSRCRWMALEDTRSTPCNTAITHKFNHKFKYENRGRSTTYNVNNKSQRKTISRATTP